MYKRLTEKNRLNSAHPFFESLFLSLIKMERFQTRWLLLELSDVPPKHILDQFNAHYDATESCVTRSNTLGVRTIEDVCLSDK